MGGKWLFICKSSDLMIRCDTEQEADAQYDLHIIKGPCNGPHFSVTDNGEMPRSWEVFEHSVKQEVGIE